jgi:Heparinase II/III-like protein/Heparinase II/III N-terminus
VFERLLRRFRGDAAHPVTHAWVTRRLADTRLYSTLTADRVAAVRRSCPRRADAAIAAAERVLRHEFELLGSGPFVPIDPGGSVHGGYTPIDWYLDPVRKLRFPRGVPHKEWKLYEMRPGNADVKYPWELARCQHWAALGQAFALTGDERFAQEIAHELDDFVEANPIGVGINFTCTMDVAIRALNWAIGFELVHRSTTLDPDFWRRAYAALYDTGVFTRANLENTYEVTSNHFLSNVVGLWFLGAVFADLPAGQEWLSFARQALEQEILVQVLPDGADYESSVPYHRLVTELFMGSQRLAEFRGKPLSDGYRARVRDMVSLLAAVTRPDGLMPQAGDADDGRLHVLADYGDVTPQDGRHLFGPAGAIFGEPAWTALAGDVGAWETAWWGLESRASIGSTAAIGSRLFPDAGLAVMRAGGSHYVLASNGSVGTKGFGNHKHNDLLSFEYHHAGVPLVVDPGSYVYTSDFEARNRFRRTASHNTVQVDGQEQNDLKPEWIFRLFETSNAEHVAFLETAQCVEYTGRHHGYERFEQPVTHERTFRLSKQDGSLSVTDRLTGRGAHDLRWHFHLAPGVAAEPAGSGTVLLSAAGRTWHLQLPPDLSPSISEADYSPSYGVKVRCLAIDATTRVTLDGTATWGFTIGS